MWRSRQQVTVLVHLWRFDCALFSQFCQKPRAIGIMDVINNGWISPSPLHVALLPLLLWWSYNFFIKCFIGYTLEVQLSTQSYQAASNAITIKSEALYFSIPCSINPFICFRDSNCSGLSGATVDAVDVEFNEPWLPPNDLSSEPRLIRSSGKLIWSPASSASASLILPFLFTPGVGVSATLAG